MKNISIWKSIDEIKRQNSTIDNNLKCDILIIGGGITGLSTAFNLDSSNKNIVLIDSKTIGNGVTSNSTGKLTVMQGNYNKISNVDSKLDCPTVSSVNFNGDNNSYYFNFCFFSINI